MNADFSIAPDYEKVIVEELRLRSSRKLRVLRAAK